MIAGLSVVIRAPVRQIRTITHKSCSRWLLTNIALINMRPLWDDRLSTGCRGPATAALVDESIVVEAAWLTGGDEDRL